MVLTVKLHRKKGKENNYQYTIYSKALSFFKWRGTYAVPFCHSKILSVKEGERVGKSDRVAVDVQRIFFYDE